jgi:hypothetical protein
VTAVFGIELAVFGIVIVLLTLAVVVAAMILWVGDQLAMGRDEKGTWH